LPANLGLAVHPDLEYVLAADGQDRYWLARERVKAVFRDEEPEILATARGAELTGRRYEPLFPYYARHAATGAFRVVAADFVAVGDGTGIVHLAPAFGEDDFAVGRREGWPIAMPVDAEGRFTDEVPEFAGKFVKDADPIIVRRLREAGKLVHHTTLQHSYPFCYRCDSPLIYRAIDTWFMRIEPVKAAMIRNNREINWVPEHLRDGRFGNWLEGARDWNLARNRYWGTPVPIWISEDGQESVCIGSREELARLSGARPEDLHRHFVDEITIPGTGGRVLRRVPQVLDCWFESGAMPYAQNHYPFENKAVVEANFPADFIAEGLDQTRGWFYTLIVLSAALFDKPAFKNVIVNGLILAADGKKMSKRLKNYPEPEAVLERYGADALRAYLIDSPVVRGEDLRFSEDGIRDVLRQVILPLWNAYSFFVTYANLDGWTPGREPVPDGPLQPASGHPGARAVHRRSDQVVHPALAPAVLAGRGQRGQGGRLSNPLHRAHHLRPRAGAGLAVRLRGDVSQPGGQSRGRGTRIGASDRLSDRQRRRARAQARARDESRPRHRRSRARDSGAAQGEDPPAAQRGGGGGSYSGGAGLDPGPRGPDLR
jgi:isoleucyl-tRNA synthetase